MSKIILRKVTKPDIKYFAIWWRDKDLARLTSGILEPITDRELNLYFDNIYNSENDYHYMIVADDITIGHVSLSKREDNWYETQIVLGNKEFWGKGYGPEAIQLLIAEAKKLEIHKIFLEVRPTNIRAISAYIKSGFVKIKTIQYPDNEFLPETLRMEYRNTKNV